VRRAWVVPVAALAIVAAATLAVVGQKVRYDGVQAEYDRARNQNELLRSDLSAHSVRLQRRATPAQLLPMAEKLGLTETTADQIALVAFADPAPDAGRGLLGQIVPEAQADESRDPSGASASAREPRTARGGKDGQ
jgi:hypothetical protein